jgi:hypothetical protein
MSAVGPGGRTPDQSPDITIFKRIARDAARTLLLCAAGASCYAADFQCSGTVQYALLYADGTVNIMTSWRGDYTYLCSTSGSWAPATAVPQEVCLSWYATAVKAAAEGRHVAVYYSGTTYTCATLPTYSGAPVPLYFGVAP